MSLRNLNRIGERGSEGNRSVKIEIFDIPRNLAFAVGDLLQSDYLRIPADSVLTNIRIIKTISPEFQVRLRDLDASNVTLIGTNATGAGMADLSPRNNFNFQPGFFENRARDYLIELRFNAVLAAVANSQDVGRVAVILDYINL